MRIGLPVGKPWPFDQMMASMMMVSANDAAYAFAETSAAASTDSRTSSRRPRKHLGLRDSTLGDPAGPRRRDVVQGRPVHERVRPRDRDTRNALAVPEIAKWAAMHQYSFTDPGGVAPRPRQPQQDAARRRRRLRGRDRVQDRLHRQRPSTRSSRRPTATAARSSRSCSVSSDSGYLEAASLLDAGFATPAEHHRHRRDTPAVAVSRCGVRAADQAAFAKLGTSRRMPRPRRRRRPSPDRPGAQRRRRSPATTAARTRTTAPTTPTHHSAGLLRPAQLRDRARSWCSRSSIAFRRRAVKRQRAIRLAPAAPAHQRDAQRRPTRRRRPLSPGHAHRPAGRVARAGAAGASIRPSRSGLSLRRDDGPVVRPTRASRRRRWGARSDR